ncbi:MAG: 1-acyl-sn-glycerol-3-phosphate acyltransferase [Bacteroidales bacterium]|nr:1-acyl-sn-glycerol-3-phosphate acyltransferase [Bacteroidales bacterium]
MIDTIQILPCSDDEVEGIVWSMVEDKDFIAVLGYVFGESRVEEMVERLRGCRSVSDLQEGVMREAIENIVEKTMSSFECHGLEQLSHDGRYLFIANHRDIVLDAFLLQYALLRERMDTTRIVIGANLMFHRLMVDMAHLNKMLTIERGGGRREFYDELRRVSEYIRASIGEGNVFDKQEQWKLAYTAAARKRLMKWSGSSVWIAQRNGRTKDGEDKTEEAVVKMLAMSGGDDVVESLASLHIVPVSISYEIEPCDGLKARELVERERCGCYEKSEGEDRRSVLAGIVQPKGRVVLNVCRPLERRELEDACGEGLASYYRNVAAIIDGRITNGYELMKTNEEAYRLLCGESVDDEFFLRHIEEQCKLGDDREAMRERLLSMYAAPYRKKLALNTL